MKILWAVSSVGLGHLMRSQCIIRKLASRPAIDIELLAPPPVTHIADKELHVLAESSRIQGSGMAMRSAFSSITDNRYDLVRFIKEDVKHHGNDYAVVEDLVKRNGYDAIVADEAFWLLANNKMMLMERRVPIVYLTDFLGMLNVDGDPRKQKYLDLRNAQFALTAAKSAAKIFFIGTPGDIPDRPFAPGLPTQRSWAQRHCQFLKPVADIHRHGPPTRESARARLGMPQDGRVVLGVVGEFAEPSGLRALIEAAFAELATRCPRVRLILVGATESADAPCIEYLRGHVPNLLDFMSAADLVVCQSGYGKVTELSALGKPFIAFPLDHHFEQEFLMAMRIKSYGVGRQMLIRESTPHALLDAVEEMLHMDATSQPLASDDGSEAAAAMGATLEALVQQPSGQSSTPRGTPVTIKPPSEPQKATESTHAEKIRAWFAALPHSLKRDGRPRDNVKYEFYVDLRGRPADGGGAQILRNVVIDDGGCRVSECGDPEVDVRLYMDELTLADVIDGKLSLFDAFLTARLTVKGKMKHASMLMDHFDTSAFPNRRLDHLTVENVFNNIDKMVDEVPRRLIGKNLYFKVTGSRTSYYVLKIDENAVRRVGRDEITVAHAKITMPESLLLAMFCGEVGYMEAFHNGEIGFNGETQLGIEFDRMFDYRFKR